MGDISNPNWPFQLLNINKIEIKVGSKVPENYYLMKVYPGREEY